MNETSDKSTMVWHLLRRHFVRIVMGGLLALMGYGMWIVIMPHEQKPRNSPQLKISSDGMRWCRYTGPAWSPNSIPVEHLREHVKGLTKLGDLRVECVQVTDAGFEHLAGMTNLTYLTIDSTQVTDASLEHLAEMTNLTNLILSNTQVAGPGLDHLKGLANLNALSLNGTHITDAGLAHLKVMAQLD